MTERIDHAAYALANLDRIGRTSLSSPEALVIVAAAQAQATLALVEQQRIANLIGLGEGLYEPEVCFVCDRNPCDREGHAEHFEKPDLLPEIAAALGLGERDGE